MKMSNSPLATAKYPAHSSNYTQGRQKPISKITVHHMAGVLSAKTCGGIFQNPDRNASSNYGIGKDAEVAVYVDEWNTPWTDSNWDSNCRSVTIETSNSSNGGNWPVSDAVLRKLIELVADIAKRNNLGTLVPGQNLTWHRMYANTSCPGEYLLARMQYIADEANKINANQPAPTPSPSSQFEIGDKVLINGPLYINANAASPNGSISNKITTITRKVVGAAHPYNTEGDLGWMDESSIKKYEEPTPEPPKPEPTPIQPDNTLKVGDTVKIVGTGNGSSYGSSNTAYGLGWTRQILGIYSGRPFPYRVGNSTGTTGFYAASALQKQ